MLVVQNIAMRNMFEVDVVQKENCAFGIVDVSCRALILGGPWNMRYTVPTSHLLAWLAHSHHSHCIGSKED